MRLLGSIAWHTSVDEAIAQAQRNMRDAANKFTDPAYTEEQAMTEPTDKTTEMLAVRKTHYGDYADNARVTQAVMDVLMTGARSGDLNSMHKEGLHMIAHKMSRIVNGDADLVDSWYDIEGYARCVRERIPT